MPRARIIKPDFWDDEVLAQSTSRDARLTFIGMWNQSDDYAVVKGNATWLKSKIFPYEEIKPDAFQKWLSELEKGRWIIPFIVDGAKYYYIQAFTKHQVINRPSQQRNPEPPQQILDDSRSIHGVLTDEVEVEREVEVKENKKKNIYPELDTIINHLNLHTGKDYKSSSRKTADLIKARMNEGFTVDDFKRVIDNQTVKWLNDPKMCEYLRPETLFGTKFESYLNATPNLSQANLVSESSAGILGWAERKMQMEEGNGKL